MTEYKCEKCGTVFGSPSNKSCCPKCSSKKIIRNNQLTIAGET